MKFLIISAILALLGVYLYFSLAVRKIFFDNDGRRSGSDRRKSFVASKDRMKRTDKERRQSVDRRRQYRIA
jgi:hypothetical protein